MIIKAATAAVFSHRKETIINKRNLLAIIPAAFICVGGYYIAGTLLAFLSGTPIEGAFAAALVDVPSNIIQTVGSAVLFAVLGTALDRTGVKKLVSGGVSAKV